MCWKEQWAQWVCWLWIGTTAGCTVGPNYRPPTLNVPRAWSEPGSVAVSNAAVTLSQWWKSFQDPALDSLVQRAVAANLDVRIAQARVREARAQRTVAGGARWPVLNANLGYTRNRVSENSFLPIPAGVPLDYDQYQAGFDASWELDVFGGTRRSVEAASADLMAAEYGRRNVLVTLLAEVAREYFGTRQAGRRLQIALQNMAAQSNAVNLTRARFQSGLSSELDVQQATALLATTEAQVPLFETELNVTAHRLAVLLGQPPVSLRAELSEWTQVPVAPPPVPIGLPSDLLQRRPDVQQAERELAAATARIGVARAELFPRFSLTGSVGLQSVSASEWFDPSSRFWSAGPTVLWRIFDAGRLRANVQVQTAREEEALARYEQQALTAFEDVENALTAYAKEQARFRSLQTSVTAQRAALRLSQDLYQSGLADFLRVLESSRALYQAEDALAQSENAVLIDLVALYKALGGGWEIAAAQQRARTGEGEAFKPGRESAQAEN